MESLFVPHQLVAPHAGAWIETKSRGGAQPRPKTSLPTRERGLKRAQALWAHLAPYVAPHAGAWIETLLVELEPATNPVAPHAGAWIETVNLVT